jgi:hypothetical protein
MMSNHGKFDARDRVQIAIEAVARTDDREDSGNLPAQAHAPPRLRVRTIERGAILRFEGAEVFFEESAVRAVSEQLNRLVEEGHTRLLVNFRGVRYLSSDVLGILAALHKKIGTGRGRIRSRGTPRDPVLSSLVHRKDHRVDCLQPTFRTSRPQILRLCCR